MLDSRLAAQLYVINGAACDANHATGCHTTPAHTTVGLTPEGVAVNQATDTIYVADLRNGEAPGAVSVVNGATCNGTRTTGCSTHPAPTAKAGFGTVGVAIDTTTDQIYATGTEDTSVSVINGATCNATHLTGRKQTPPKDAVGNLTGFLAVDHANHTVYVTDNRGTDLSLIPTARWQTRNQRNTPGLPCRKTRRQLTVRERRASDRASHHDRRHLRFTG